MITRAQSEKELADAIRRSPVVLLVGARQVGKTTLARTFVQPGAANYFDLEDPIDLARLSEPMLALQPLRGVVVIDEVQRHPDLFPVLRVLADRPGDPATFLVLGSASPDALRQSAESLAGRVEVIELPGLGAADVDDVDKVWIRGGYPRSTLAATEEDSMRWRRSYIRTLASRDLREFGLTLPAASIERFLAQLAQHQSNLWNAASTARALGIGESTARRYVDGLNDAMLVRTLKPWTVNAGKRLIRTPKVFLRDTGLLHALWGVDSEDALRRHPGIGASWESLAVDEVLRRADDAALYFWRTSNGAEVDLVLERFGSRNGFEMKRTDAPRLTSSMVSALEDSALALEHLWVLYPGNRRYSLNERATALPLGDLLSVTSIDDL
ncbi:ATP-binding protein [Microbacterium sp. Mu-80]|uniref:ATP-binding protein n=1 Tax=Microbacterium bandirmense TaxID=3122050 RepID=A0ABU8LE79_9MICO